MVRRRVTANFRVTVAIHLFPIVKLFPIHVGMGTNITTLHAENINIQGSSGGVREINELGELQEDVKQEK